MSETSETYVQQITDLASSFSKSCAAAALFYWGDFADRGLRIEASTIMKEFVNNIEFGTGRLSQVSLSRLDYSPPFRP
jgi:hypothetical protein